MNESSLLKLRILGFSVVIKKLKDDRSKILLSQDY